MSTFFIGANVIIPFHGRAKIVLPRLSNNISEKDPG
jgi:hypothetical protein